MRILVVEDNRDIAANIGQYMDNKGHVTDFAFDGVTGLHLASVNDYDIIVLDLMLPALNGVDVCRRLRTDAQKLTPVLMLTARDSLTDKLDGLAAGADDYLVKPFSLLELEARLMTITRRAMQRGQTGILSVGDLVFDPGTQIVRRAGRSLRLGPTSRKILLLLMRASPSMVSRAEIERQIWSDEPPDTDALRAHIYTIRNAVDKPFAVKLLHTLHSTGYRLCPPDESQP